MADTHTEDKSSKMAFVWFTYMLDHPILLRSVKSVRTFFPAAKLYIIDDTTDGKALPRRVIRALANMGCGFVPTGTPRKGNLRGWACARMIASTYKWVIDTEPEVELVVKVDSDALMLNPKWITELLEDDTKAYGGTRSKCHRSVCGPTYALKREAVMHLWESYQYDMESPYHTEEDFEAASRLCRAYKADSSKIYKLPYSFNGVHPEFADAQAGMFVWSQNSVRWYEVIANTWQQVVLGYPAAPYKGKTQQEYAQFIMFNNLCKAGVMKRIFALRMRQALTEK